MRTHSAILAFIASASILVLSPTLSTVHAYGNTAQWQIGFSGTCNVPTMCGPPGGTGTFGFWGWCEFGGSSGSTADGTTGTSGDCQVTTYARSDVGQPNNPTHLQIDISAWTIGPSAMSPTGHAFIITTTASLECTGPGSTVPPTPVSGCALPPGGDTGAPPVAGHYALHPFPGFHINTQVNQLP